MSHWLASVLLSNQVHSAVDRRKPALVVGQRCPDESNNLCSFSYGCRVFHEMPWLNRREEQGF